MNLSHLRYFVELAHTQHYTRAAERLCITQPSLSHAIAQLEMELGVPLFEKSGRSIALTRFGEQFLVCAEQTLSTLDEGVYTLQRVARGEGVIRLGRQVSGCQPRKGHSLHFQHRHHTAASGRSGLQAI